MNNSAQYIFCIPEKIKESLPDIEKLAIDEIPGFKTSYLLELFTLISLNIRKDVGETRLKAKYIKKHVPGYEKYFRFLIDLGIIRKSGRYVPGEISYSYAYTPEYVSKFKYFPVNDMFLINRIKRNNLRRHNSHKYPGQSEFIRKLTIDPDALNTVNGIQDIEKHNAALSSVLKIQQKDIYYSVDNTSGRFHSNLTNLPESLRPFVRIEGKPLSNIDIKNSQPYLSIILLKDPSKVSAFAKSKELSMLLETSKDIDSMDVTMFIYLTIKGKLYEYLMQIGFAQDRREAKRQLFVIMFGPGSYWSKRHEIFERNFPAVYERFGIIKGHARRDKFNSYNRFAILLQRVEAHLVLDTILPRIFNERPGTIAVTIHDSVMTSVMTNDVELVHEIMNDELFRFVGYQPTLKVENLPQNSILTSKQEENRIRITEERIRENQYHYDTTNLVKN